MDFALIPGPNGQLRMSLDAASDIRNNILLSLHTKRGSFFVDPDFGSRLHEIHSTTKNDLALTVIYAKDALKWIIEIGRLKNVNVVAFAENDRVRLVIQVESISGQTSQYTAFAKVT